MTASLAPVTGLAFTDLAFTPLAPGFTGRLFSVTADQVEIDLFGLPC